MATRKIVCLGGGSLYFTRALPDLVLSEDLGGSEIVLYDIDGEKVELMARMGRRVATEAGTGFSVRGTTDLADAVDAADRCRAHGRLFAVVEHGRGAANDL